MKQLLMTLVSSNVMPGKAYVVMHSEYPRLDWSRFARVWNAAMHRVHGLSF